MSFADPKTPEPQFTFSGGLEVSISELDADAYRVRVCQKLEAFDPEIEACR